VNFCFWVQSFIELVNPIDLKGEIQTLPEDRFTKNPTFLAYPWSDLGLTIGGWVGKLIIGMLFIAKYI
jgi:hypothetical protein